MAVARVRRGVARTIPDVLQWSSRCREQFLPWRLSAADAMRAGDVAEAGISDIYPGYELGRPAPHFHLLVYTTHGRGLAYTADCADTAARGQVLLVSAGTPFGYKPSNGRWRFLWFHLPPIPRWRQAMPEGMTIRRTILTDRLDAAIDGFLRDCRRRSDSAQRAARLHGELIALYIERELGAAGDDGESGVKGELAQLWDIVASNLKRPWTVDDLAAAFGVSPPHFHRLVREHYGTTPMRHVYRLRMEHAQEMLVMHNYPVRVVAAHVGFQNEFAFSTAFKRFAGVSPGVFRSRK